MSLHYDDLPINEDILLDLPYREGTGVITQDLAKPHHSVALVNTPAWTELDSGLTVLTWDGESNEYLECAHAACEDLDFTDGDYSIGLWFNRTRTGTHMFLSRCQQDVSGWELYIYNEVVQLMHHHAGTLVPPITGNPRTGAFSLGWTQDVWWFLGLSRVGGVASMYRGAVDGTFETLDVSHTAGGLVDPETSAYDLVNCRYSKDANFFYGMDWRKRVWGRSLSAAEWAQEHERTRGWFA